MVLLPTSKCCCCRDDCEGYLEYEIEWPTHSLTATGSMPLADTTGQFFVYDPYTGAYFLGTIELSCKCCVWTVKLFLCGASGAPGDYGSSEWWEGTAEPSSAGNGCPEPGSVTVEPIDPPSEFTVTMTFT